MTYETVKLTEQKEDASPVLSRSGFSRIPDKVGPVTVERVTNFTCPVCGEVLAEAVLLNGSVKGRWCGVKGQKVV